MNLLRMKSRLRRQAGQDATFGGLSLPLEEACP
jgi:hypothetical protein